MRAARDPQQRKRIMLRTHWKRWLLALVAFIIPAVGLYYLVCSVAGNRLSGVEQSADNAQPPPYWQRWLPGVLAFIVLAAGWNYLFQSLAASRLAAIEQPADNALRIRLRRANGIVMMLLAVAFFASYYTVDERTPRHWAILVLISIPILLCAMISLALIDVRLTRKLRRDRKKDIA